MRAWLFDKLTTHPPLQAFLGGTDEILDRVLPRRSETNINAGRPFLIFGLGNATNEELGDPSANDHEAYRQFFQIWVHDDGGSYLKIDNMIEVIKSLLTGSSSKTHQIIAVHWLENSAEFSNQTYNTNFRYIRFQAVIAKGKGL